MSNIGNKKTFAKNLQYYLDLNEIDRTKLAKDLGFPYSTVTDWLNAKKYPRMDRIELMAAYFKILKSDLIEEKKAEIEESKKNNDIITDIVIHMRKDIEFLSLVETLHTLDSEKIKSVKQMLSAFLK